jgi:hypothetical protein
MMKKYYDQKRKELPEEEEDNKQQDWILLDGIEVSESVIIENIHIWRLLFVIYSVLNTRSE